jgi:thiol-disulfide isomerase/thioredoxin
MLRKSIFTVLFICTLAVQAQYKLDFKVNGLKDTTVLLLKYLGDKLYYADTAESKNGRAIFQKPYYEGGIYAFYTGKSYFEFIMNEKEVIMETTMDNFNRDMVVKKSVENKIFYDYIKYIADKRAVSERLVKERDGLDKSKDSLKIAEINTSLSSLDKEVKEYQRSVVEKNPTTLVSKILKMSMEIEIPTTIPDSLKGQYYREHYFDNFDFTDQRMARSPVFGTKFDYYYKSVIYQIPDSILKYTYPIVDQIKDSTDMMKFVLNYIHTNYETSNLMGMDAVYVGMSKRYYCPPVKNKGFWYPEQNLKDRCERTEKLEPLLLGKVAPPITLADTSEKKWINVHNLPNKHVVLIFWDPDCGHCKKEIPKLLKVYNELKEKKIDIEFIAVGTELENEKWRKFIRENNMNWLNVSDFPDANKNAGKYVYEMRVTDYKSLNFRKEYDIFSTPQIYLLDEKKEIVAKRLDANNLARILEIRLQITLDYKEDPKDKEKEKVEHK